MKIARYKPAPNNPRLSAISLPTLPFGWDDLVVFCAPRSIIQLAMRSVLRS